MKHLVAILAMAVTPAFAQEEDTGDIGEVFNIF